MSKTNDSAGQKLVDSVSERPYNMVFPLPQSNRALIARAAKTRGLPVQAYVRRAIMAMVCHDLRLDWSAAMRDELPILWAGRPTDDDLGTYRGREFGNWTIKKVI